MSPLEVLIQKDTLSLGTPGGVYQLWFTAGAKEGKISSALQCLGPVLHSDMPKAQPPHANTLSPILARL